MAPLTFEPGPVSLLAARGLALGVMLYAVATLHYAQRGFENRLQDRWSALGAAVVMVLLAALLWARGAQLVPAPYSLVLLVVYVAGILLTITYTLGRYQERIDRFVDQAGARLNHLLMDVLPEERYAELQRLRGRFILDHEELRKSTHLLMGVLLASYLFLGHLVLVGIQRLATDGGESSRNLALTVESGFLASGHMMTVTVLLALLFLFVPNELLRLRYPELSYPFKAAIERQLREREKGLFGAHYYIVASTVLVLLWLNRDLANLDHTVYTGMAVIIVAVFADAASALFGIRWGRRKWFHNRGKSYLGSVAGTGVAFLLCLPFTGATVALVCAFAFLVVDILAPVPFPISDNILNPLALALAFDLSSVWLDPWFPYY